MFPTGNTYLNSRDNIHFYLYSFSLSRLIDNSEIVCTSQHWITSMPGIRGLNSRHKDDGAPGNSQHGTKMG
jgi:hypothetical protein